MRIEVRAGVLIASICGVVAGLPESSLAEGPQAPSVQVLPDRSYVIKRIRRHNDGLGRFDVPGDYLISLDLANRYDQQGRPMGGVGETCGMFWAQGPANAHQDDSIYVLCGGKLVDGPLRTKEAMEAWFARFKAEMLALFQARAASSQAAFNLGRSIRARWPTGKTNTVQVRVYDRRGYSHTETRSR
jgi:hypothetical protein